MRLDLPSGAWIDVREQLKAADLFKAQGALRVTVGADGKIDTDAGVMALVTTTLLARVITAWSYDAPLPGTHACPECTGSSSLWHQHVNDAIGETVDLDDWPKVTWWTGPLVAKVLEAMKAPNQGTSSG